MNKMTKLISASVLGTLLLFTITLSEDIKTVQAKDIQPYYFYEGQTSYGGSFILDDDFVNAVKIDNVSMNGYKIDQSGTSKVLNTLTVEDQILGLDKDGKVVEITFPIEQQSVSMDDFNQIYSSEKLVSRQTKGPKQILTYETKNCIYTVTFKNKYLTEIRIALN